MSDKEVQQQLHQQNHSAATPINKISAASAPGVYLVQNKLKSSREFYLSPTELNLIIYNDWH
jgi:hypothetical protein